MKIVWVNGCFDLIHLGHIELLKFAKSQGDLLYVGIDSDARIRDRKGVTRPIQNEKTRYAILSSFTFVDKVCIYDTDYQLERLIADFGAKEMVLGSDYVGKRVIGGEFCEKITFFDRLEGFSTTNIVQKIANSL